MKGAFSRWRFQTRKREHFDARHWDHERRTSETLPPTCCRPLAGRRPRCVQSPPFVFRMHYWDHEPRTVPRRTESADKSDALQTLRAVRRRPAVAKRLECVRLQRRFCNASCNSMARFMERTARTIDALCAPRVRATESTTRDSPARREWQTAPVEGFADRARRDARTKREYRKRNRPGSSHMTQNF